MNADILAFGQVVLIDLVLAGDNAVIVGALAANLPAAQRRTAILVGIGGAVVARIALSLGVVWLLKIPGVMLIGAALLFWVAWKMWRDLRADGARDGKPTFDGPISWAAPRNPLRKAIFAIVMADLSMSLDNVLGVAGAAAGHTGALVLGLLLSIVLMGAAASVIASLINKHRWIAYVGLALIVAIACRMFWHGIHP
jgi:YjbE family integral membrane protein